MGKRAGAVASGGPERRMVSQHGDGPAPGDGLQLTASAVAVPGGVELRARWLLRTGKSPLPVMTAFAALPKVALGPQSAGKLASIELTRAQLLRLWPERYQSMSLQRALWRLFCTPRIYKDAMTLVDPHSGSESLTLQPASSR